MNSRAVRVAVLAVGMAFIFGCTAVLLLRLIPAPSQASDYLVVGTLATLVTLGALFAVLAATHARGLGTLFRRRNQ